MPPGVVEFRRLGAMPGYRARWVWLTQGAERTMQVFGRRRWLQLMLAAAVPAGFLAACGGGSGNGGGTSTPQPLPAITSGDALLLTVPDGDCLGDQVVAVSHECDYPPEIAGKIFDPFFTTKEVGKGTGQGLAIARAVVETVHGGKLWFEAAQGGGTTFWMRLPLVPARAPA